jgi:hypothetical protein
MTTTIYTGKCLTHNCPNEANPDTGYCDDCEKLIK